MELGKNKDLSIGYDHR